MMNKFMTAFFLSILFATAGCSNKAPKGQGGLAEHNYSNHPNHPVGLEDALYFEQSLTQRHLDALLLAGANICFPASVKMAKNRQVRIARELQGGLKGDAANDLIIQRDQLDRLQRRLNYVKMQDSCIPAKSYNGSSLSSNVDNDDVSNMYAGVAEKDSSKTVKTEPLSNEQEKYIITLLNNNNQFVTDSTLLNPRYIGQLSEASQLLRSYPQYHLKLTGHSDSVGSAAENLKLSIARAVQVERYLLIFGLSPNNIQVEGSGEMDPLFIGEQAEVNLVNRRVHIELINTSMSSEAVLK